MKAKLEFEIGPDGCEDFEWKCALNGRGYYFAVDNVLQYLRSKLKYEEIDEATAEIYEEVRDYIFNALAEEEVTHD